MVGAALTRYLKIFLKVFRYSIKKTLESQSNSLLSLHCGPGAGSSWSWEPRIGCTHGAFPQHFVGTWEHRGHTGHSPSPLLQCWDCNDTKIQRNKQSQWSLQCHCLHKDILTAGCMVSPFLFFSTRWKFLIWKPKLIITVKTKKLFLGCLQH